MHIFGGENLMDESSALVGKEKFFDSDTIIISKTDLSGKITYVNNNFLQMTGYKESEVIGRPHSIVRHSQMPRSIFALLWSTIKERREIFIYLISKCKNNDYYWANANIVPTFNAKNELIAYHCERYAPDKKIIDRHILPLYNELLAIEKNYTNSKEGMLAAIKHIQNILAQNNVNYDEYISSLAA